MLGMNANSDWKAASSIVFRGERQVRRVNLQQRRTIHCRVGSTTEDFVAHPATAKTGTSSVRNEWHNPCRLSKSCENIFKPEQPSRMKHFDFLRTMFVLRTFQSGEPLQRAGEVAKYASFVAVVYEAM
jgi:hypothetical protein